MYEVNYDDERFQDVETEKQEALTENEKLYGGMIEQSDSFYQAQIDAAKDYADTQQKNQQEQTDFAIEQVEQQKEQAHKDYLKEQTGAYVDWQKQSNQYGVNAEQMAAQGLAKTGFSETSQVTMYNTYQNRVATAREAYTRAVLNYDNAIKDAILQNNAALAEIAYQALQKQLELSLQGFQYKNTLLLDQADRKLELDNIYYQRRQDVLDQINTENALAEQVRQHNAEMGARAASLAEERRQFDLSLAEEKRQFDIANSGTTGEGKISYGKFSPEAGAAKIAAGETISTPYYQGKLNSDVAKYGTFTNGYQPRGISGHGKLVNSGTSIQVPTEVLYGADKGKEQTLVQAVWKAEDGTLWYWEGRENKYKPVPREGGGGRGF